MMDFEDMLGYCAALEKNNNRPWFHENHKWYEKARGDFVALLELMRFTVAEAAPELADDILYMPVKNWMYRIARDMRYYKDRPPYQASFRAYISPDKKSYLPIGYFLRIMPGGSCLGTGLWCETTEATNCVRDYISLHWREFEKTAAACSASVTGSRLKKVPRGYDPEDPAADWLKLKDWFLLRDIPDESLTSFDAFRALAGEIIGDMEPMRKLLLRAARSRRTHRSELEDFYR